MRDKRYPMEKQIQTLAMNNGNTWWEREDKEGSPTVFNLVVLHIDVNVEPVTSFWLIYTQCKSLLVPVHTLR